MTVPSALVAASYIVANYLRPLPRDPNLAFIWQPTWWTWGLAALTGLLIVAYLAWLEQFNLSQALSGRPDIVFRAPAGAFQLENANNFVAVNLRVEPIEIPIPQDQIAERKAYAETVGHPFVDKWTISFDELDKLTAKDPPHHLNYTIYWKGTLLQVLEASTRCFKLGFPVTVVFSNLGEPKRTWHSHYRLRYRPFDKSLGAVHESIHEVHKGKTVCSGCTKSGGGNR